MEAALYLQIQKEAQDYMYKQTLLIQAIEKGDRNIFIQIVKKMKKQ